MPAQTKTAPKRPSATAIAKLRKQGKTWNEVREALGVKLGSGPMTAIMAEAGLNAGGVKPGETTKAIVRNGSGPKPAAKKASSAKAKGTTSTSKAGKAKRTVRVKTASDPQ